MTLRAVATGTTLVKCDCRPKGEILGEYLVDQGRFWRKAGDTYARQCEVRCPKCGHVHRMDVDAYVSFAALRDQGVPSVEWADLVPPGPLSF